MNAIETDKLLELLADIRKAVPRLPPATPPAEAPPRPMAAFDPEGAVELFELDAVLESLGSLATDLGDALDAAETRLIEQALDIFYAAEELSHDPAHAALIPHVQRMRESFEREYGMPIPEQE